MINWTSPKWSTSALWSTWPQLHACLCSMVIEGPPACEAVQANQLKFFHFYLQSNPYFQFWSVEDKAKTQSCWYKRCSMFIVFSGEKVWFALQNVCVYSNVLHYNVCVIGKVWRLWSTKVFFFKKEFSILNKSSNLKNSRAGTGAHLYECQRCGNWSMSHRHLHFKNNFPCWLLFRALLEWLSVHLRTILMCGIWMDTWKLWSFELRSH